MKITSTAFVDGGMIPEKYTCHGEEACPELKFSGLPAGTKSLAIIVNDPDAPSGDFVHWLVWNIDPAVEEIMECTVPIGAVEGVTDFGRAGWGGPCPPSGIHRYMFRLYALSDTIDLPETADKVAIRAKINDLKIEETVLVGLYGKEQ